MPASFVHLRLHTEYSLVDGLVRIKPLVKTLAGMGMPAVAVTDQNNMCSLVKFYKAAMGTGIKPICGADLWLSNKDPENPLSRISLLVMNAVGYRNLTELISRGFIDGQRNGQIIIEREWVAEAAEGLIMLSAAKEGEIGLAMLSGDLQEAETLAREWMAVFPDRFYLEVQRTNRPNDEEQLHAAVALADKIGAPLVATNDVRFIKREDFEAHETRVCIGEGRALDDPRRSKNYSDQQYLKSAEEMAELFSDLPEALENTVEIAKRCNIEVKLGKHFLPDYPIPDGMTIDEYFRKVSFDGLEERLSVLLPKDTTEDYEAKRQVYVDRLNFELDIIIQMGFPGYFLIVMDFIQWAKSNGVPVGPGRGSGAGSLVAYVQKITDLDPLAYDLLFERFLNPERVSMPDFDVDFCMDGRDRVIDYVAEKYGRNAVSQIITFGSMAAKAVVRDVARVQGKSYGLADRLSKMIPFEVGMTLEKAYEQEEILRDFIKVDEEAAEIWEMARKLEGVVRNVGKHAGGVVIAPTKLTDFSPIYCDEAGDGLVTQFDKDDVEAAGLVKFDFLGLRTLTIIKWAMETINREQAKKNLPDVNIDFIPLDDKKTYELLQKAETTAVFQLESRGMKELIKKLKPDCLEDLIALVALFRPGPLQSGMVDDFINRKHGRAELAYPHPDYQYDGLRPVLAPTYGIILYQEQVMQIAQVMAGYTLGGADMLRRAMGKKKPEEMAKQRGGFIEGCANNGIDADLAGNIFDLVEKFAGYGFNKSHSAAYGLVSYQTAWLKTHHPAPFMAAVLSADMHNTDKVVVLIEEVRSMKLRLDAPDVNSSDFKFTVNNDGRIVYGLGAIKGVGEGPVEAIVEARAEGGPFKDLFDFCSRVDLKRINKRTLDALIRSGALDRLGPYFHDELKAYQANIDRNRAVLLSALEEAVKAAEQTARTADSGHADLFGGVFVEEDADVYANHRKAKELTLKERLKGEKDTLGLYLTGHPIDEYEGEIRRFARQRIVDLKPARDTQTVAGMIIALRVMKNKKGDKMGFITLDDRSGRIEASLFADAFHSAQSLLQTDAMVVVEGEVSNDDFSGGLRLRVKRVMSMEDARTNLAESLRLKVHTEALKGDQLRWLGELCKRHRGACPISMEYTKEDAKALLQFGEAWRIDPADALIQALRDQFGRDNVFLQYR
ncbi:DNA polymerase III subunit alpha [Pseudomonas chlororaphis]|uniref:DNA polymerase III subunit alpha n=1 Tax=Pseudomonas chlororaphis subsp. aurantiaca TaxID=86192 RepID=A0AAJ0ZNL0_9PSED|nr:DNA polymerase III subunit alpha [Pseudomonas chlororaphis]AZD46634.1 DNA polymerase III alpha subunit [Pseudomonas chlororaphis subsp. aurantiaca]MBU4636048.1 DNA polymerase III subunit alpha [Pseudomonas chlororaphis subsp. aurantiaca]QQX60071.1 DNA polymerase III subunit alpha [Pseudomonas chlororaphis subsp. aurantiaca]UVE46812.1 DNA polymerase III subunit alpha [Pseudomonas chlororaphis]BAV73226.1 DNA polymerase III subunit alpha [Pseudomonas chlororaphis subsp. aurantiaca]